MDLRMPIGDISFWAILAFLLGALAVDEGWNMGAFAVALLIVVVGGIVFGGRVMLPILCVIALGICFGVAYAAFFARWQNAHRVIPQGRTAFFGIVTDEPRRAGNVIFLSVALEHPYSGMVDVFASPNADAVYGDEVWLLGTASPRAAATAAEPPAFFLPRLRVVASHEGFLPREWMIACKTMLVRRIRTLLPSDEAALLIGMIAGGTEDVSAPLKAAMEDSGTSYILGMYGYKIALISAGLAAFLVDRVSRHALMVATIFAIILFVLASGGAVSVVRAAIMGSVAVLARGFGRRFSARNAVACAALGMALGDPTLLVQAGFQLSFLSYLGIHVLGRPIMHFLGWTDGGFLEWKQHTMLSLSTNLAILPVAMNALGGFPLLSLLSNMLIMVPWLPVFVLGLAGTIVSFIVPAVCYPLMAIVSVLLKAELWVIQFFAAIPLPTPALFGSPFAVAFYFGALIIFSRRYAAPPNPFR